MCCEFDWAFEVAYFFMCYSCGFIGRWLLECPSVSERQTGAPRT